MGAARPHREKAPGQPACSAAILSEVTGRRLEHRAVYVDEVRAHMVAAGIPDAYAAFLAGLEDTIAGDSEDRTTEAVLRITGRPPRSLREVATHLAKVGRLLPVRDVQAPV